MNKRAQVTLIIAIALFILIIAALIFYVANYFRIKTPIEPLVFERASIENYINGCVKKTAEDGLRLLGKQGGFINLEELQNDGNLGTAYLPYNKNQAPSIEEMQNELSSYVSSSLSICLKGFDDFKKQGWDIDMGSINSKATINKKDVLFEVYFPLKVSSSGNSINFERFIAKANVRLKYIHEVVGRIFESNIENPKSVDRTALSKYDVNITVFPYDSYLVYAITDPKSLIMNKPYMFALALRFG